jgi:fructose-1,6-bisphosphatase
MILNQINTNLVALFLNKNRLFIRHNSNMLSGSIPAEFSKNTDMLQIDISNKLSGTILMDFFHLYLRKLKILAI